MNYKGIKDMIHICELCGGSFPNKYYSKVPPKYCSMSCQVDARWQKQKLQIEQGLIVWSPTQRKYLAETRGYSCESCSISTWNGQELTLQVDHIDGNPDNNFPSNLRLLCPNCHSLTPTYKGGNKNNPKNCKRAALHRGIYKRNRELVCTNSN